MDKKKKQRVLAVLMVFIAIIFISSYAAFGNNNVSSITSTTTIGLCANTYLVFGVVNSIIVGYGNIAALSIVNRSYANTINQSLSSMTNNGTVSDYIPTSYGFDVYLANMTPYQLAEYFNGIGVRNLTINSTADIKLPQSAKLQFKNYSVPVALGARNITIVLSRPKPINSSISVDVHAFVYNNGSICNNQLAVTEQNG